VIFAHDTELALVSAAVLVNTAAWRPGDEDTLLSVTDLERFLDEQGWSGSRLRNEAELGAVRELRQRLRRLWELGEAELVDAVNDVLSEAGALPQLVDHDGIGWHIHAVPQEAPLATRMAVEAAMAFVDVIRAGELDRLKTCAASDCDDVVVDLSRNRSKRFCEGGCGNREHVRAYRDRQRTD
jgi:predicted RNA-binding Zn ribbon-like protein